MATIKDVAYAKGASCNLFRLTYMLRKGWEIHGTGDYIKLKKDKITITFDIKIRTPKGMLFVMKFVRTPPSDLTMNGIDTAKTLNITKAHRILTHIGEEDTRKIMAHLGYTLTRGTLKVCDSCGLAKAKRKAIVKFRDSEIKITTPVENAPTRGLNWKVNDRSVAIRNPNWRLVVDEYSQLAFSTFHASKDKMVEPTCE